MRHLANHCRQMVVSFDSKRRPRQQGYPQIGRNLR